MSEFVDQAISRAINASAEIAIAASRVSGDLRFIFDLGGMPAVEAVVRNARAPLDILATKWERWTPIRKLEVLNAIATGQTTTEEVQSFLGIGAEELADWQDRLARHGMDGLSVRKRQAVGS